MTENGTGGPSSWRGDLSLGDVLEAAGIADLNEVLVIRHTSSALGLSTLDAATPDAVVAFTRHQHVARSKFPSHPPRYWLVFLADGKYRSRFYAAFENGGEAVAERTDASRYYDLQPSELLASLADRLVIDWGADAINWVKSGTTAAAFKVVEVADRDAVAFPSFDQVALMHAELQLVANDPRYAAWRAALGSVQGIYVISDASNGKLYVGQADGHERILGRWRDYAATGHGGNKGLVEVLAADPGQVNHWTWSILRVFGSSEPPDAVDKAEQHFMHVLRTREFGYNS